MACDVDRTRTTFIRRTAWFAGVLLMFTLFGARGDALQTGMPAPAFSLTDQYGKSHALADYQGSWLVLYFYPKDDTPGCTTEACAFRDDLRRLKQMHVALLGVSLDDVDSHRRFADKFNLPFPLLADTKGETARAYGALWSLGPLRFARRQTFIIDPHGRVAHIYRSVDAAQHSEQVIRDLEALGVAADR